MKSLIKVPHAFKLTQAKEFQATLSGPCRIAGKHFVLRARGNGLARARLGLIASRKAARRAVDRNRGKRLARCVFVAVRDALPPLDLVLQLRTDLRASGNPEIRKEIERLLREAAVRCGAAAAI